MKTGSPRYFLKLLIEEFLQRCFISLELTKNEKLYKSSLQGFCLYSRNPCMYILSFTEQLIFRTPPDDSDFSPLLLSFFISLDLFELNFEENMWVCEENISLNLMSQYRPYIRNTMSLLNLFATLKQVASLHLRFFVMLG